MILLNYLANKLIEKLPSVEKNFVVVVVVVCLFWHSSTAYKLIVLFSLVLLSLAAILMYLLCVCVRSALISKICAST